ncbi:hypothetical protein FRC06_005494 [Ceratobasidium sp. 370]|nr:hypothetical protein FRC06_005494 [Ceratobasidium sp. 370]
MDNSGYSAREFGWETHAQADQRPDNFVTQHFEVASSQPDYTSNPDSRRLSHQDLHNLAHDDKSLHRAVAPSERVFSNSYTHSHPPHQQPVSYYGTHYTHQHFQRAHRYPQTQYQRLDRPRAPSASNQSALIDSAAPQPRVNDGHYPLKPPAANQFTPYGNTSRPVCSGRMADPTVNRYNAAESDVGGWGYTDVAGPAALENNTGGEVDRSAPALPVTSRFANLTLAQHNPPGVTGDGPVRPSVPPVAPIVNGQRAQSPVVEILNADSGSDTIMPDAFDLIPPKPANHVPSQGVPSQGKKKSSASAPAAPSAPSAPAPKSQKATRALKMTVQKAGDDNTTSNAWTVDHLDLLIRHILDSDENFKNAEKKGGNLAFWKRVSEHIFDNKRSPEALQQRWKELKVVYQQVKALESFTGGNGDGEFKIDDDDSEGTILDKLRGRLDLIHEQKPNIDPQRRIKSADIYWNWIRGGDDSWYRQMHTWFRDSSTFDRKRVRRSGSLSPLEIDSNSDGETSKSDINTPKRSVKSRAGKTGTRGLLGLDAAATAAKEFFATQHSANNMKNNMALERLKFDQERAKAADERAKVADELSIRTMEMRCETQKRKWSNEERMAEIAAEDAKRRRLSEDKAAQDERALSRVRELNKLVADPTTDPELREIYREKIKAVLSHL